MNASGENERGEQAFTVTQAMNAAKRGLEKIRLTVIGEVSEFNDKPGYKAAYFTIRDDSCAMPCLMWRERYRASGVDLRVGMLVELTGNFSCYPAKGRMQFSVSRMALAGEGNLRLQVAQIARKLDAEGLMDPGRKRGLPALPQRIAVVTSPRGKAVHDVIRTLRRRYPLGELLVCGVPVEGRDAPRYLAEGLAAACAADPAPEVILLVRGGGSYEDLMPFNDEGLARAVAACPIPVVTGIGHEPDNSICDMVSDRRCSTPTAAAEAVAPSLGELQQKVDNATAALGSALVSHVGRVRQELARLADRPLWHDPHYFTGQYSQALDFAGQRLARALPDALEGDRHRVALLADRLQHAGPALFSARGGELRVLGTRLRSTGPALLERNARAVALAAAKLEALSPLKTLSRGYAIAYAPDGHTVVDRVGKARVGDALRVQVSDGTIDCTVNATEGGDSHGRS